MSRYNTLNVKLSNSELNKLKSGIKNGTKITLNLSSIMPDNSYDDTSFPCKLFLTDAQVSRLRKAFANNLPANIKSSKTHPSKVAQSG